MACASAGHLSLKPIGFGAPPSGQKNSQDHHCPGTSHSQDTANRLVREVEGGISKGCRWQCFCCAIGTLTTASLRYTVIYSQQRPLWLFLRCGKACQVPGSRSITYGPISGLRFCRSPESQTHWVRRAPFWAENSQDHHCPGTSPLQALLVGQCLKEKLDALTPT